MIGSDIESVAASNVICHLTFLGTETSLASSGIGSFSFSLSLALTLSLSRSPAGPNAISVSLSPMGCYVMVGLASRRILLHPTTDHMVAQVFRLQQPHGGETSIRVREWAGPAAGWSLN